GNDLRSMARMDKVRTGSGSDWGRYKDMAKVEMKTKETDASVEDFLNAIENETRRADGFRVLEMYKRVTGEEPKMWGPAIIGFGNSKLKYPDGREIDWMLAAFSPRKQNLTLYV